MSELIETTPRQEKCQVPVSDYIEIRTDLDGDRFVARLGLNVRRSIGVCTGTLSYIREQFIQHRVNPLNDTELLEVVVQAVAICMKKDGYDLVHFSFEKKARSSWSFFRARQPEETTVIFLIRKS